MPILLFDRNRGRSSVLFGVTFQSHKNRDGSLLGLKNLGRRAQNAWEFGECSNGSFRKVGVSSRVNGSPENQASKTHQRHQIKGLRVNKTRVPA
jgi:hypothetical protein